MAEHPYIRLGRLLAGENPAVCGKWATEKELAMRKAEEAFKEMQHISSALRTAFQNMTKPERETD